MQKCFAILIVIILLASTIAHGQSRKIKVVAFRQSKCEPYGDPFKINTRIIDQKVYGKIFSIKIGTSATCCVAFVPTAILQHDALLLGYEETGDPCDCSCYYEFTYDLENLDEQINQIYFEQEPISYSKEKFKTYDIGFNIVNSDTLDYQDKYGRKQGKWHLSELLPTTRAFVEYKNDTLVRRVNLFENGSLQSEVLSGKVKLEEDGKDAWLFTFGNHYREYFESGILKKECKGKTIGASYWEGTCKEWNEKGELIYQGAYQKQKKRPSGK